MNCSQEKEGNLLCFPNCGCCASAGQSVPPKGLTQLVSTSPVIKLMTWDGWMLFNHRVCFVRRSLPISYNYKGVVLRVELDLALWLLTS